MRSVLGIGLLAISAALVFSGLVFANNSVRMVPSTEGISANFKVTQTNGAQTQLAVDLTDITVNSVELDGKLYDTVELPTSDHLFVAESSEEGAPNVPVWTTLVILDDQHDVDVTVSYSGYDLIDNINLAPCQKPTLENGTSVEEFTINEQLYSTDSFYPENIVAKGQPEIMRDIRFAQISIYPVQYNPVKKQLKIFRDLQVEVTQNNDIVNPKTVHRSYISEAFYPLYKSMFANFDQLYLTKEIKRGGYMIIVKDLFLDTIDELAIWKRKKGYDVVVVPTTEIDSDGNPATSAIADYIETAYETWDVPPEYIMIVGDEDGLTTTGVVDYQYQNDYASDHAYTLVDGSDYLPDIFIARLSVDSQTDLNKALAKVMKYDSQPFMGDPDYYLRALSVGANSFSTPRTTLLGIRQLELRNGYTQVDTAFGYNCNDDVSESLNNGVSLVQYRGYGMAEGWSEPYYTTSELGTLSSNQKLSVVASIVCGTADFGYSGSNCFGEYWIRMGIDVDSLKGGPAYYGTSDHYTHTRYNNPHIAAFFAGLFNEGIYHFAATAVRGKMGVYYTFPSELTSSVKLYFHTYNMLGDPEIEIRTAIPIMLDVEHRNSISLGENYFDVLVTDTAGNAISGAYVTFLKGDLDNEEFFAMSKTDESGYAELSFEAVTAGSAYLTVTGRNLYPCQDTVEIAIGDIVVGLDSLGINDDIDSLSYGNNDKVANPGETIELNVSLKNFGNLSASGLTAVLEPFDAETADVYSASSSCGDLDSAQTAWCDQPFVFYIDPSAKDGDDVLFKLTITDDADNTWYCSADIPISSSNLVITDISINNDLNPGGTVGLTLTLENQGSVEALGLTGTITSSDDFLTVSNTEITFGDIDVEESGSNASPLTITADTEAFDGHQATLVLHLATQDGWQQNITFTLDIGTVSTTDPMGPDEYGYYMYDNTDTSYSECPTYSWVEINNHQGGDGTKLSLSDDDSELMDLPFDFVYYGQTYTQILVCMNGFIAVDTATIDESGDYYAEFFNWPMPDQSSARGMIAPFWDDLYATGYNGVYVWSDTTNHRFLIEWYNVRNRNSNSYDTLEVIIYDPVYHPTLTGDAEIAFQYFAVDNDDSQENYATVGFESWDEAQGLQYTYDNDYNSGAATLAAGRAIKITTNTGLGGLKGVVGVEGDGDIEDIKVTASTGEYRYTDEAGAYWITAITPGTISLTAEKTGYFPTTVSGVVITANQSLAQADLELALCPTVTGLQASSALQDSIVLSWQFAGHDDLTGYNVYRSHWQNGIYTLLNDSPISATAYTDYSVPSAGYYWYYITAVYADDDWTTESLASDIAVGSVDLVTGIDEEITALPDHYFLAQNYPNPFNPTTSINYGLLEASPVKIDIYNILGQQVRSLADDYQTAGYKTILWDGNTDDGSAAVSGIYFYKLETNSFTTSKKMILLK